MNRKYLGAIIGSMLVLFILIGAATNYNRIILDEDPEITGANDETISNATNGRWTFSDDVNIPSGSYYMVNGTAISASTLSDGANIAHINAIETVSVNWQFNSTLTLLNGEAINNGTNGRIDITGGDINIDNGEVYKINDVQITTSALSNSANIGMLNEAETVSSTWVFNLSPNLKQSVNIDTTSPYAGLAAFAGDSTCTTTITGLDTSDYIFVTSYNDTSGAVNVSSLATDTAVFHSEAAFTGNVFYWVIKRP